MKVSLNYFRSAFLSALTMLLIWPFYIFCMPVWSKDGEKAENSYVKTQDDLKKMDPVDGQAGNPSQAGVENIIPDSTLYILPPNNLSRLKEKDLHRKYLKQADKITQELISFLDRLDKNDDGFTLQQLAAFNQQLALTYQAFKQGFTQREESFYSYRLIDEAVQNIGEAVRYWRTAQRYQTLYRGSRQEASLDDELVKLKLSKAREVILALKNLRETQEMLNRDFENQ